VKRTGERSKPKRKENEGEDTHREDTLPKKTKKQDIGVILNHLLRGKKKRIEEEGRLEGEARPGHSTGTNCSPGRAHQGGQREEREKEKREGGKRPETLLEPGRQSNSSVDRKAGEDCPPAKNVSALRCTCERGGMMRAVEAKKPASKVGGKILVRGLAGKGPFRGKTQRRERVNSPEARKRLFFSRAMVIKRPKNGKG